MPFTGKNIYFAADFHLGVPNSEQSLLRERKIVSWLNFIQNDVAELYLMGDIFDFWFEYRTAVPRGYTRLLGKLAEMTDNGIKVHLFKGNHDLWAFNYLEKEIGIELHRKPEIKIFGGKKFFIHHGDGLGPGDRGYKFIKYLFECKANQWLFRVLHPDLGLRLGLHFSKKSRLANIAREQGKDTIVDLKSEMLYIFCQEFLEKDLSIDYFVFGHRHVPLDHKLNEKSHLIILGDWITNFTYAKFDGEKLNLEKFE